MNGQFARAQGIGEVLAELRAEFPDVSVSKIRFLESEGLISPARSPSGYRRFGPADVDKLRFILTAQRDQYLPLRVIKERLEQRDAPVATGAGAGAGDAAGSAAHAVEMVGRRELIEAAGIDDAQLAEMEAHGLVHRVGRLYRRDAVEVAAAVGSLAPYGVQARHMRVAMTAADREVALIEQLVAPVLHQRGPGSAEAAGGRAREIAALLLRLHRALLDSALAEAGLPGLPRPDLPDAAALSGAHGAAEPRRSGVGRRDTA
jgi:DNA-binding transcriptional MerR regulator